MVGQGSIPGRGNRFYLLRNVHTGSGAHLAFYPVGIGDSSAGGKVAGA
jgi:hypothetical protein